MYIYDFICTYKLIDECFRDDLYQQQILEAFNLTKYDELTIKKEKEAIYEVLKDNLDFLQLLEKVNEKYPQLCKRDLDALSILFSYDYFDLFHRYLIDYFMHRNVNINMDINVTLDAKLDPKYYKSIMDALKKK